MLYVPAGQKQGWGRSLPSLGLGEGTRSTHCPGTALLLLTPTQNITFPPLSCKMNQVGGLCRHYGGAGTHVPVWVLSPELQQQGLCIPSSPCAQDHPATAGPWTGPGGEFGFPVSRQEGWNTWPAKPSPWNISSLNSPRRGPGSQTLCGVRQEQDSLSQLRNCLRSVSLSATGK